MRFLFYYPRAMTGDGGPTVTLWSWAGALAERGHDVGFLHAGGSDETPLQHPGVWARQMRHAGSGRTLRPVGMGEFLEPEDLLVLNSGYVGYNLVAARAAQNRGTPYVVIPQGAYDPQIRARRRGLKRLWEMAERPMLERALGVHLAFESEVEGVQRLAPRARTIVAPTGAAIAADRWAGGGGYLAWVGRYDMEHKGLDVLVQAMAVIRPAERPKVILHGRDHIHTREEVRDLARSTGVADWIDARGPIGGEDKRDFLRSADGYVLPSRWECHSTALLEALSLGIPSLVSSGAHIARSLSRRNAAIVADATPQGMAEGLVALPSAGRDLGERGRSFVDDELDWDRVVASLLAQVSALRQTPIELGGNRTVRSGRHDG